MRDTVKLVCLSLLFLLYACQPAVELPKRSVVDIGGPERVFARPLAEIVPQLQNARASGPNGRVGDELVFWGYELVGGRPAFLVGCAVLPDVDCAARLPLVCASGQAEVLFSQQQDGEVRHLDCEAVGIASVGELHPNCTDTSKVQPVAVSLLRCN